MLHREILAAVAAGGALAAAAAEAGLSPWD